MIIAAIKMTKFERRVIKHVSQGKGALRGFTAHAGRIRKESGDYSANFINRIERWIKQYKINCAKLTAEK